MQYRTVCFPLRIYTALKHCPMPSQPSSCLFPPTNLHCSQTDASKHPDWRPVCFPLRILHCSNSQSWIVRVAGVCFPMNLHSLKPIDIRIYLNGLFPYNLHCLKHCLMKYGYVGCFSPTNLHCSQTALYVEHQLISLFPYEFTLLSNGDLKEAITLFVCFPTNLHCSQTSKSSKNDIFGNICIHS